MEKRICLPGLKREISEYVAKCLVCQQVKVEHQDLAGLVQPLLLIPGVDLGACDYGFVMGLHKSQRRFYAIGVIVDRLSKSTHFNFLPIKSTFGSDKLARMYADEIGWCHLPARIYLIDRTRSGGKALKKTMFVFSLILKTLIFFNLNKRSLEAELFTASSSTSSYSSLPWP